MNSKAEHSDMTKMLSSRLVRGTILGLLVAIVGLLTVSFLPPQACARPASGEYAIAIPHMPGVKYSNIASLAANRGWQMESRCSWAGSRDLEYNSEQTPARKDWVISLVHALPTQTHAETARQQIVQAGSMGGHPVWGGAATPWIVEGN